MPMPRYKLIALITALMLGGCTPWRVAMTPIAGGLQQRVAMEGRVYGEIIQGHRLRISEAGAYPVNERLQLRLWVENRGSRDLIIDPALIRATWS